LTCLYEAKVQFSLTTIFPDMIHEKLLDINCEHLCQNSSIYYENCQKTSPFNIHSWV